MTDHDGDIVVLTTTLTEAEAAIISAALEEEGIQTIADGGFVSGFKAEAPGRVRVIVREEDSERARIVLKNIREHRDDIDWSKVDVGEPESE